MRDRDTWKLARPTPVRSYCVQYRETNLAFVCRLLESEGIFYTLDPDGTLVLANPSSAAPPVSGQASFELLDAAGALDRGALGIHQLSRGARSRAARRRSTTTRGRSRSSI